MDIGKIGDKGGKGKKGDKGKKYKGKGVKDNHGKGKGKSSKDDGGKKNDKERCAICRKTSHATDKCWYNSKGHEKGKGKSQRKVGSSVITMPSSANTTPSPKKSVRKIAEHRLLVIGEHTKGILPQPVSSNGLLCAPASQTSHKSILVQGSQPQTILGEDEPPEAILAPEKLCYLLPLESSTQSTLSGQRGS